MANKKPNTDVTELTLNDLEAMASPKELRFVSQYIIDLNAAGACRRAGYSEDSARWQGYELLGKPYIQELIRRAEEERAKRVEVTQDMVLKEIMRYAFLDPRRFYDADGNLIPVNDLSEDVARAVGEIEIRKLKTTKHDGDTREEEWTHKIKTISKADGLEKLAKHLGLYKADNPMGWLEELIIREKYVSPDQEK